MQSLLGDEDLAVRHVDLHIIGDLAGWSRRKWPPSLLLPGWAFGIAPIRSAVSCARRCRLVFGRLSLCVDGSFCKRDVRTFAVGTSHLRLEFKI